MRWFKEPLTEGALKGSTLNLKNSSGMLYTYYAKNGWYENGVSKQSTLERLGLAQEAKQIEGYNNSSEASVNMTVQSTPYP
jgi:aldehyde:ferredoxin oxidoreductase